MAQDPSLGAGNFMPTALACCPSPSNPIIYLEKPLKTFWGERFTQLSYLDLNRLADSYAAWYLKQGITPFDPVFIYLDDGIEYFIHYLALTRIGAIGVLTNGNMPAAVAYAHARNTNAVGVFTDKSHSAALKEHVKPGDFKFFTSDLEIKEPLKNLAPPKPFRHVKDDPILIAHSSGTTGTPKAVLLQHEAFFYGVRYRLGLARIPGGETILSSLPHSHNCAIAYFMLAMLSGTPVYLCSDHNGEAVMKNISRVRPKTVVSFPQTYVEMVEAGLDAYDLSSVNLWFNAGDAAHEGHIRELVKRGSRLKDGKVTRGSIFIDGMGSSEMGFSLFRNVHTPETNNYGRCVGKALEWVDAQILSEDGEKLGPNVVGRLGVKAPSVSTGYWNNSHLTFKSRLSGYFLTGDMAYRSADGNFYHVDRVPDVIRTEQGPVYGLQTEELLLSHFKEIADCSVFGQKRRDSDFAVPVAFVRFHIDSELATKNAETLLEIFNAALSANSLPTLSAVRLSEASEIPLGTTGKVLKRILRSEEERIRT